MARFWNNITNSLRARKGEFTGTSGNEDKIGKRLDENKSVNISNPTSQRTFTKGEQTRNSKGQFEKRSYTTGNIDVGDTTDQYSKKDYAKTGELVSTAIDSARYDPNDNSLNITYKGGDKEYKFAATPEDVKEWIDAPSKGQITQEWRETHRYPGY